MRMTTISEAQDRLPDLLKEAQAEPIGLLDESGALVGLVTGVCKETVDELLVETPGFRAMIARSRASLEAGSPVSAEDLLAEAEAELGGLRQAARDEP